MGKHIDANERERRSDLLRKYLYDTKTTTTAFAEIIGVSRKAVNQMTTQALNVPERVLNIIEGQRA